METTVSFQDINDYLGFCAGTEDGLQVFEANPNLIEEFEELKELAKEEFLSVGDPNRPVSEDLKSFYRNFCAKYMKAEREKD